MNIIKCKSPIELDFRDTYLESLQLREQALERRRAELQQQVDSVTRELETLKNNISELVL